MTEAKEVEEVPSWPTDPQRSLPSPASVSAGPAPPSINHPFFSLPPCYPATTAITPLYLEAKKNRWPMPIKQEDPVYLKRYKVLTMPLRLELRSGDTVLLHDWLIKVVSKAFSLSGLVEPNAAARARLRGLLLSVFFYDDMSNSLAVLCDWVNAVGGRKAWNKYTVEQIQAHRSFPSWTLESLFPGQSRQEIAEIFEERTGVRVELD